MDVYSIRLLHPFIHSLQYLKKYKNWQEFVHMVDAGMPAGEALQAATVSAAELLGQTENLGSLEVGKLADIVAYPRNPIEDITVMGEVAFVMKGGVVFKEK